MNEAYDKGLAVGVGQITNDCIFFRFKDETFEFPAYDLLGHKGVAHFNGVYYEAKVSDLRRIRKMKEKEHG